MMLKRLLFVLLFVVSTAIVAYAVDSDSNGINDVNESSLVEKFMPCLQLDIDDDDVSPKPVEIMGCNSDQNMYLRMYNVNDELMGEYRMGDHWPNVLAGFGDVEEQWPHLWGPGMQVYVNTSSRISNLAPGIYQCFPHWEWGSPSNNNTSNWRSTYQSSAGSYPDKVYVHMWRNTNEICIQYWFFYPYNDWINNHEGDWERICVVVSDENPNLASILRIEFGMHHYFLSITDFSKCFIVDLTHPVVFVGGFGSANYGGEPGQGPSGHGCFPFPGDWERVGGDVNGDRATEHVESTGGGKFINYTQFTYQILKEPEYYDYYSANMDMLWFRSGVRFGHLDAPSPGSEFEAALAYLESVTGWGGSEVGNTPPQSPLYNWTWHKTGTAAASACPDGPYNRDLPYSTATQSGWGLHVPHHYTNLQEALNAAGSGMKVFLDQSITIDTDINVPSGITLEVKTNISLAFGSSQQGPNYGCDPDRCELVLQNGSCLILGVNSTLTSLGTWGGVYKTGSGSIDMGNGSTISNAQFGIFLSGSSAIVGGTSLSRGNISNCAVSGIRVSDGSPIIHYLTLTNCGNPLTNYGNGIEFIGASAAPAVYNTTVSGSVTQFGWKSSTYALPRIYYSKVEESVSSHKVFVNGYGNLDIDQEYNEIYDSPSNYAVYIGSNCPNISVRSNYWGQYTPYTAAALFSDPSKITSWDNPSTTPYGFSGKAAAQVLAEADDLFRRGRESERAGAFGDAIADYENILTKSQDEKTRVKALRYLYAATEKNGGSYAGVREKVTREIADAVPVDRVVLRYLLGDMLVKEGKYDEAVGAFLAMVKKYEGSSVEVDALVKVAMISGLNLGDKAQAEKYADMAKSLNPGHPTLLDAYAAAGISYEPWKYENKYAELVENLAAYDAPDPKEKNAETAEFVSVSPNPANPVAVITYSIKSPSAVKLSIYSINGQKVATLVDGQMSAGVHSATFNGAKYASGVYFYRFESSGLTKTGKMLLLK